MSHISNLSLLTKLYHPKMIFSKLLVPWFFQEFLVSILILLMSTGYYRFLQFTSVTTGYYRLLQFTIVR